MDQQNYQQLRSIRYNGRNAGSRNLINIIFTKAAKIEIYISLFNLQQARIIWVPRSEEYAYKLLRIISPLPRIRLSVVSERYSIYIGFKRFLLKPGFEALRRLKASGVQVETWKWKELLSHTSHSPLCSKRYSRLLYIIRRSFFSRASYNGGRSWFLS